MHTPFCNVKSGKYWNLSEINWNVWIGHLHYHKYYQAGNKLSKEHEYVNKALDNQDPMQIAM